jgi:hypothetical protein
MQRCAEDRQGRVGTAHAIGVSTSDPACVRTAHPTKAESGPLRSPQMALSRRTRPACTRRTLRRNGRRARYVGKVSAAHARQGQIEAPTAESAEDAEGRVGTAHAIGVSTSDPACVRTAHPTAKRTPRAIRWQSEPRPRGTAANRSSHRGERRGRAGQGGHGARDRWLRVRPRLSVQTKALDEEEPEGRVGTAHEIGVSTCDPVRVRTAHPTKAESGPLRSPQ